jgi:hypothetical protein
MSQQRGRAATPYYAPPTQQKQATAAIATASRTSSAKPSSVPPGTPIKAKQRVSKLTDKLLQWMRETLKGQFTVIATVSMLLSLALAVFASQSFSRASDDLNTIAYNSIPSVDAAQAIAQYVNDSDAKSADFLGAVGLNDNPAPCSVPALSGPPVDKGTQWAYVCDRLTINADLLLANQQLFNAARNVTYPGERTAVERITEGLEEYSGYLELMMNEYDQVTNRDGASDPHLQAAYQEYLNANNVLYAPLDRQPQTASGTYAYSEPADTVPTCQPNYPNGPTLKPDGPGGWATGSLETDINCLSAINQLHLDNGYTDTLSFVNATVILFIIFSLIFCGMLLFVATRMLAITHRVINISLSLALLAGIVFSVASIGALASLNGNHGAYGQMVKDDYQSVYDTDLLNRVGTNANADESRWLIALKFSDPGQEQHWAADWQSSTHEVSNLLSLAKKNQTWTEEIQPLADMQNTWNAYYAIDGQIRSAATNSSDPQNLHTAGIINTGKSDNAFKSFTDAVDRLKAANYDHYYNTLNTTQSMLNLSILLSAIIFPLIGILAVWGISRRFRDF